MGSRADDISVRSKDLVVSRKVKRRRLRFGFSALSTSMFKVRLFTSRGRNLILRFSHDSRTIDLGQRGFTSSFNKRCNFMEDSRLGVSSSMEIRMFISRDVTRVFVGSKRTIFATEIFPKGKSGKVELFDSGGIDYACAGRRLGRNVAHWK